MMFKCCRDSLIRGYPYGKKVVEMRHRRTFSTISSYLNISESKAEYLSLKYPAINKLTKQKLQNLINTVEEMGFAKSVLVEEPMLFGMFPVTIKFRFLVLKECAIRNIRPEQLKSYLQLVKQKTIGELKENGEMLDNINIENRLASYMTQWPTSLTTLIYEDVNKITLHKLRLKILQRYLELVLDLTEEEFYRGVETYPTIKHRPLAIINETLSILQAKVMIPIQKIKNNLYLVHADPDNLKQIIYDLKSIGGIDIKEVIRLHPRIAIRSYSTLVEIRQTLQEYGISNEAQIRCFPIYTLSPSTIRERIEKAKTIPEFSTFFNHPRFLKMILYNNTAMKRLSRLYNNNKKCLSLNILSGSSAHYETFEKAPGDRLGKGKDLIFCLSQALGKSYSKKNLHKIVRRHPFWINIPLVQVKYVYEKLSQDFTSEDIFINCPIVFYPWSKIKELLNVFKNPKKIKNAAMHAAIQHEYLDLNKLNNTQRLSLILYMLEKNHYFTGNGVWTEEKSKNNSEIVSSTSVL